MSLLLPNLFRQKRFFNMLKGNEKVARRNFFCHMVIGSLLHSSFVCEKQKRTQKFVSLWQCFSPETGMKRQRRQNQEKCYLLVTSVASVMCIFTLLLTACKSTENADSRLAGAPTSASSETRLKTSGKLDVCALVTKAEVEKILGQSATSADSGRVTEGTETTTATSQCSYKAVSAQTIELFVRRSPVADNTPEAIQRVRDTMKDITQKEPLDIKDTGDQAFWTAGKQLHVLLKATSTFTFRC
jgi:hypothetical protein